MTRFYRIITLLFIFSFMLTCVALGGTLGEELHMAGTELADGTQLANGVHWSTAYSDMLAENFLEYTPSSQVIPMVVYGSKVQNYGNFATMANLMEKRGYHVIGGINGDFFDTGNYNPLGIVITEGILRSSDGGFCAVGFRADGTAFMGYPSLEMKAYIHDDVFPIATVNKPRLDGGYTLFTEDYSTATKNKKAGRDVILSVKNGDGLRVNASTTLVVEQIVASQGSLDLPAGKMVLSLSTLADAWRQSGIDSLAPGDEITVTITSPEPYWQDAQYAVGSFQKLVTNGNILPGLDATRHPRTAVGIKADGTVLLYTIDGRQPGVSIGASLKQVAERLIELGCVEATIMDGGGSTSLNALYIGDESLSQINNPSGGTQRSVTNYIMLASVTPSDGVANRLGVYPYDVMMLAGASQHFSVKAADRGGYPANMPASPVFTPQSQLGTVTEDGVFKAGTVAGKETLLVESGEASGFATITIVDNPDAITVYSYGPNPKPLTSLTISAGSHYTFSATASYHRLSLVSDHSCFSWSVEGNIGSIDANGYFTASNENATGAVFVSAGDKTVRIPVTVTWDSPFGDVKTSDWFYDAVKFTKLNGILSGVSEKSFAPYTNLSRGMFVTALGRMAKLDASSYQNKNAFSDVTADSYYAPYVAWAAEIGLVDGFEDSTFRPNQSITREQLCTMISRYCNYFGKSSAASVETHLFTDASHIASYAAEAVQFCKAAGIVNGYEDGSFAPRNTTIRGEAAAMLQRTFLYMEQ